MKSLLVLLLFAMLTLPPARAARNVLLIIADDLGTDGLTLYNSSGQASLPNTPNLNALAARGVMMRNFWSCPTCSPSRSCTLTGRYGFRTGVTYLLQDGDAPQVAADEFTIPRALARNPQLFAPCGYASANVGKWHMGDHDMTCDGLPANPLIAGGYTAYSGELSALLGDYYDWPRVRNWRDLSGNCRAEENPHVTTYATTDNTNDAIAWIRAQAQGAQASDAAWIRNSCATMPGTPRPWFLWLAYNAPHTPYDWPPNGLHSLDSAPRTPRNTYNAMVESMDTEMGRLFASIQSLGAGVWENTDIVFMGDNGTPVSVIQPPDPAIVNGAARGKSTLYESGVRVPCIMAGPDITLRGSSNVPAQSVDLCPTILEWCGVNVTASLNSGIVLDGQSMAPFLAGTSGAPVRTFLYTDQQLYPTSTNTTGNIRNGQAVRNANFKYIRYDDVSPAAEELYNLNNDPWEQTNLLAAGVLAPPAQTAYNALKTEHARIRAEVPPVLVSFTSSPAFLEVKVQEKSGWTWKLWQQSAFDGPWQELSGVQVTTSAGIVTLRKPLPNPAARLFFRATAHRAP